MWTYFGGLPFIPVMRGMQKLYNCYAFRSIWSSLSLWLQGPRKILFSGRFDLTIDVNSNSMTQLKFGYAGPHQGAHPMQPHCLPWTKASSVCSPAPNILNFTAKQCLSTEWHKQSSLIWLIFMCNVECYSNFHEALWQEVPERQNSCWSPIVNNIYFLDAIVLWPIKWD